MKVWVVRHGESVTNKKGLWTGCVFPTGIVEKDGLLYIYYGGADTFVSVATVPLDDVLEYMKQCKI